MSFPDFWQFALFSSFSNLIGVGSSVLSPESSPILILINDKTRNKSPALFCKKKNTSSTIPGKILNITNTLMIGFTWNPNWNTLTCGATLLSNPNPKSIRKTTNKIGAAI